MPHEYWPPFTWDTEEYGWGEGYWQPVGLPMRNKWCVTAKLTTTARLRGRMRNIWKAAGIVTFTEYEPVSLDDYLKLVPWQHRREKFLALLRANLIDGVGIQNFAYNTPRKFDVDTAYGKQLDSIGRWVGFSRKVSIPIDGVYFTWDDTLETGWGQGMWIGPNDPVYGLTEFPDYIYRKLIKAKIVANSWDGTKESAYEVWDIAFNDESSIAIIDNQDMSMDLIIFGIEPDSIFMAVLAQGLLPLKPAGVRINYHIGPVFAWDWEETKFMAGFGIGHWVNG